MRIMKSMLAASRRRGTTVWGLTAVSVAAEWVCVVRDAARVAAIERDN